MGGAGSAMKEKARDMASGAAEVAGQAKEKAQEWASTAAEKAGEARATVGQGMESIAGKIREKGPQQGMLGSATSSVADTVEAAGTYLQEHDFADMGKEVTNLIRRYPIPTLLVGIGLGFLLARATRS